MDKVLAHREDKSLVGFLKKARKELAPVAGIGEKGDDPGVCQGQLLSVQDRPICLFPVKSCRISF